MRATIIRDQDNHNRIKITGWAHEHYINEPTGEQKEEEKKAWMIQTTYNQQQEPWIVNQLRLQHPIMIVSDGSYHPEHQVGTSAWVITSEEDTTRRIYGDNVVPGDNHIQCPHRSELTGLLGAVRHIEKLCQQYNITNGQVEIACDGMEAYKIATRYKWNHTTNIGHYDVASCLHQLLQQSKVQWTFRHVYGHQDNTMNIDDIDIWGQLNMVADAYAKAALWSHVATDGQQVNMSQLQNALPSVTTTYNGKRTTIVSNLRKRLGHHLAHERILQYWHDHGKPVQEETFDTAVFTHAAKNVPLRHQRWISKWSCGICGVGKWLERWKDQNHSKCPRCLTDNETVEHVVHCRHDDAELCWSTGIEEIQEWMRNNNALPGLAEAVGRRLSQWRIQVEFETLDYMDESVRTLIQNQDELGWDSLMFGSVHTSWSQEQGDYLHGMGLKTTGYVWMSKLIRKLWLLQHSMWIHRNSVVHKEGKSMHQHEVEAVDRVIREEFIFGRNGLSQDYAGLFQGNVRRLLNKDPTTKVQWLYRVWTGRDRIRTEQGLDPWYRDPLAATFIKRNHTRRKRRRKYDVLDEG